MRMLRVKQEIMDDDEKGKLFVGGLSWETTQDNLQRYFSRYGEVIDCVVMKNAESGRSRGFGFVTFADPANVNVVLQNGPHNLDGRTIDPKPCNPRTLQKPKKGGGYPKVFLGGLPSNVTETDLRSFFTRFGKVMEVVIMYDQEKKKSRGFGFLSFEDDDAVDRCVSEHFVNLNGKQVEIKKAEPRDGSGGGGKMSMGGGMGGMGDPSSAWGPPQPPMGMMGGGPNGQMGGPPMNLAAAAAGPMGPNMMQAGYQGWGAASAAHQQQAGYAAAAGYGAPSGGPPTGYQGWGAAPAPQGPPHQWGGQAAGYGGPPPPPQQQGYGQYGEYGPNAGSGAASWNSWTMAAAAAQQNSGSAGGGGPSGYMAAGDMYSRGGGGGSGAPATPGAAPSSKSGGGGSDYGYAAGYGGGYSDGGGGYPPRSYGGGGGSSDAGSQVGGYTSGGGGGAAAAGAKHFNDFNKEWASS